MPSATVQPYEQTNLTYKPLAADKDENEDEDGAEYVYVDGGEWGRKQKFCRLLLRLLNAKC